MSGGFMKGVGRMLDPAGIFSPGPKSRNAPGLRDNTQRLVASQQFRQGQEQQHGLRQLMMRRARGEAPSVAEQQQVAGLNNAQADMMSAGRSARGVNRIQAQRNAMLGGAGMKAQVLESGRAQRAAEQQAAEGAAAGMMHGMQSQNLAMQQMGQQDQFAQLQADVGQRSLNLQASEAQKGRVGNVLGSAGGVVSSLSDIRLKDNVRPLESVKPYSFEYNDKAQQQYGLDDGPQVGIMAQDLEKSPALSGLVEEDELGNKAINGQKAINALMALSAATDKRLAALEAGRGGGSS